MAKLAVLADIHGNSWALHAVLADLERRGLGGEDVDVVNLGDVFFGPLDPAGTAKLLRQREMLTISGNQDRLLWRPEGALTSTHQEVLESLGPRDLAWLEGLPNTLVLGEVFLCHGTPTQDDDYLLEAVSPAGARLRATEAIAEELASVEEPLVLCAHSHKSRLVQIPGGPLVLNPGSVGLPAYTAEEPFPHAMESGSPHARYALVEKEEEGFRVEMVAVSYDHRAAAEKAERSGRSDWARSLASGRGI